MSDIDESDLYGGLAGVALAEPVVELESGVQIRATFAHLMSPFLLAFEDATPGTPHPAPWRAAQGGLAIDIRAEIVIPKDFAVPKWFDRLNTMWWTVTLLRLRVSQLARLPVVSSIAFRDVPKAPESAVRFWPVEVERSYLLLEDQPRCEATSADLQWLTANWLRGGRIANRSQEFNVLAQAFSDAQKARSPALALLSLWSAIEGMFSPARTELRFRVSSLIASYLEPPGIARQNLQREVARLYDARSSVAHGTSHQPLQEMRQTYELVRRILAVIIESGSAPSRDDLEAKLFGSC